MTPLESLEATLRTDMAKIFDELPRVRPGESRRHRQKARDAHASVAAPVLLNNRRNRRWKARRSTTFSTCTLWHCRTRCSSRRTLPRPLALCGNGTDVQRGACSAGWSRSALPAAALRALALHPPGLWTSRTPGTCSSRPITSACPRTALPTLLARSGYGPCRLCRRAPAGCSSQHSSPRVLRGQRRRQKIIMENKDLDLPTQRQLLAQYRCAEIAKVHRPTAALSVLPV